MDAFICHVAEVGPFISLHICLQLLPQRETHLPFREGIQLEAWSNDVLLAVHCFIDDHARNALAVGLLLRCVNTMRLGVNRQAVHFLLNWKILYLAVVVGVVHLEYRDSSTRTGHIHALQSRVEFDDVGPSGHRQKRNRLVFVEIEHSHQVISLAGKEGAVMLRVQGHPVISFASADWIPPDDFVRRGIDDREMFSSCRFTYTLRATGSYCGIPVSLSKCRVLMISSLVTSTIASAFPRSSET